MDDIVYTAINRYFDSLSKLGYVDYNKVYSLLFLILIREFIYTDFYGYITEDDYRHIEKSLYCILGKSCLTPYPLFIKNMNNLNLNSVTYTSLLAQENRKKINHILETIESLEDDIELNKDDIDMIKSVKVLKKDSQEFGDVPDIIAKS